MKNYIQTQDTNGNFVTPELVAESLLNLERFHNIHMEVKRIVEETLETRQMSDELAGIKDYADDFYTTWFASSTELIDAVGIKVVIDLFEAFHKVYVVVWDHWMMDIIEDLAENVVIYRGESRAQFEQNASGLSWSLHEGTAKAFKDKHEDGILLRGLVAKKRYLGFWTR